MQNILIAGTIFEKRFQLVLIDVFKFLNWIQYFNYWSDKAINKTELNVWPQGAYA